MIEYGTNENWKWDSARMAVRFEVTANGKPVTCIVTRECIDDHMGNPESDAARLREANERFDAITDKIGRLIALGRIDENGMVFLRTADW